MRKKSHPEGKAFISLIFFQKICSASVRGGGGGGEPPYLNVLTFVLTSLYSYHYGNFGLVTYSGVRVTFSSCSISSFNHR